MPKSSGRQTAGILSLAIALVSACGSASSGDPYGASGAAGSTSGAPAHAGTNSAGSDGVAGKVTAVAGGSGNAGERNGDSGAAGTPSDSGGAQNIFIDQIVVSQGGGPPRCLPRSLPVGSPVSANDGQVACVIAELKPEGCDCSQPGRAPLAAPVLTATKRQLQAIGVCGGNGGVSCDTFCGCEIVQTPGVASDNGSELYACQNELTVTTGVDGFCLVDQGRTDTGGAPAPLGNPAIVAACPANEKRLLRFVGAGQPASGATAFIGCTGSPLN